MGRALVASAPDKCEILQADRSVCDLADSAAIGKLLRDITPDVVINAAAYTAVDKAESEEAQARAINADAVAAIVAAHSGKLVHISTDYVFDGTSSRAYRPDDTRNPVSAYGRTKAAGEDHLRESDLLVRSAWIYAAGRANFVRTMLKVMAEREEVRVVADQIGGPTWAQGLATTIWKLIAREASGTFHHSDAGVASWYDFAVAIQEEALALGLLSREIPIVPITTDEYPTPARRPAFSLLDSSATRTLIGDRPVHWRANLRKMLAEEKAIG